MCAKSEMSFTEISKPIVSLMRFYGFRQQMPRKGFKYFSIQMMRILIIIAELTLVCRQSSVSMDKQSIRGYFKTLLISMQGSFALVIVALIDCSSVFDRNLFLNNRSRKRLHKLSHLWLYFIIINCVVYVTLDLIKYFHFKKHYILIYYQHLEVDHSDMLSNIFFFTLSVQYFFLLRFPLELVCIYCSINCLIVCEMFAELNLKIASKQFNANHLRRVQQKYYTISDQAFRLSKKMSIALLILYYHFVSHTCEYTFHIASYIRDVPNSG